MPIKESGEMYLETIYVLCKTKRFVRSIDIAEYMDYSKPSVSRGVGLLKKQGYIDIDNDGYITLTVEGTEQAEKIFERHTVFTEILKALGVDEKTAVEDACRIEHVVSEKTFNCIKKHLEQNKK